MNNIYLDNAATSSLDERVKEYIIEMLNVYGNPSSTHSVGDIAKQLMFQTRNSVARFINAESSEIIFTCGGSASNELAIQGFIGRNKVTDVFYSPLCHKSILLQNDGSWNELKVNTFGEIDIDDMYERIKSCKHPFIIIESANSEIGSIQNVEYITSVVHDVGGSIYVDYTGSISTEILDVKQTDVDMAGFSAHKLGALKGCGVLYKKSHIGLKPLIHGTQEEGLFGGTENTIGIASLKKAIEIHQYDGNTFQRNYVWRYVRTNIEGCYLIGRNMHRLNNNLYICFKGVEANSLVSLLDSFGIQVSTGSACNSGITTASSALIAIGLDKKDLHSCIRITFKGDESEQMLDYACSCLKMCVNQLRGNVCGN